MQKKVRLGWWKKPSCPSLFCTHSLFDTCLNVACCCACFCFFLMAGKTGCLRFIVSVCVNVYMCASDCGRAQTCCTRILLNWKNRFACLSFIFAVCCCELQPHNFLIDCPHFCMSAVLAPLLAESGGQTVSVFGQSASLGWPYVPLCAGQHSTFIPYSEVESNQLQIRCFFT